MLPATPPVTGPFPGIDGRGGPGGRVTVGQRARTGLGCPAVRLPRRRAIGHPAAVVSALLAAGLLAGCSGSEPAPPPPLPSGSESGPASASASASGSAAAEPGAELVKVDSSAPVNPEEIPVFADYVRFWQRDMLALGSNDQRASGVLEYLFPPQLQATARYLAEQRKAGRHTEGAITISPEVTSVRGSSATVKDCLDQSGSYDVDRAGHRFPPQRPHLPLVVALQRGTDQRWKVSDLTTGSGTC
jgi:hypothetical protein